MIDHDPPADRMIDPELAETIKSLPEERQLNLLKLLVGDMTAALFELIRKMSGEEQQLLLQQLQETPDLSSNPEETEIALRRHYRRSCMITTDYMVGGRSFEGFILDISRTGAFIETDETFSAGQQI
ncbi:PilZ domain-containing protein, partial [archaeon]|nr:PilZ domain-containing protein [archaeon]